MNYMGDVRVSDSTFIGNVGAQGGRDVHLHVGLDHAPTLRAPRQLGRRVPHLPRREQDRTRRFDLFDFVFVNNS